MHLTVCIWFCAQRAELDKVGMTLNRTFPNFLYRVRNWIRFLLFSPLVICRNPSLPITDLQHFGNFSGIKYTCRNKQRFHLHSCAQSSRGSSLPAADFCSLLWRRNLVGMPICMRIWLFCAASRVFYRRPWFLTSGGGGTAETGESPERCGMHHTSSVTRENCNGVISLSNHDKHVKLESYWNHSFIFKAQ